jgi:hypothetical protein
MAWSNLFILNMAPLHYIWKIIFYLNYLKLYLKKLFNPLHDLTK